VPPVYIDPSAKIDSTAKLGPNVSIGPRAVIAAGARIKDSIVLEGVEVKHDAAVFHSILGRGCKIGSWARIEGSAVAPNDHSETLVKDGAKIQSVTILSSDVNVSEEVHVQNTIVLPHKDIKNDVVNEVIM
jgi:mannose-1-phosphate guanylyltransferase